VTKIKQKPDMLQDHVNEDNSAASIRGSREHLTIHQLLTKTQQNMTQHATIKTKIKRSRPGLTKPLITTTIKSN
jgi:hypothetical protein